MRYHEPQWSERIAARNGFIIKEWSVDCSCGRYRAEWDSARGAMEVRIRDHMAAKEGRPRKRRR